VGISNGLAWSPDSKTMYYIDTPTHQVMAYDYDLNSGEIANPRVAVNVPAEFGWPDGMTSDTQGRLWVALWAGHRSRYGNQAQVSSWSGFRSRPKMSRRAPSAARTGINSTSRPREKGQCC